MLIRLENKLSTIHLQRCLKIEEEELWPGYWELCDDNGQIMLNLVAAFLASSQSILFRDVSRIKIDANASIFGEVENRFFG
jgi:hypothetical protein